ncbi:tRNA pseudouridine(13) synthase TruD [Methylomagnum sp.]
MTTNPTLALPHAHGGPVGTGQIKTAPEDFVVEEILGFDPSGDGEHEFLRVEKRGENTEYVARQLARFAGIPARNVGYAGLKDRHGRTIQWFSVQLPGKAGPDWTQLGSESIRVLDVARNNRKLKKGAAFGNRFELTVRELAGDRAALEQRLSQIAEQGVPNYFGSQRFGWDGQNLERARELFDGTAGRMDPHKRGIYLSAARSEIFNQLLARRVADGTWNRAIPGDAFMFGDSRSFFKEELTPDILQRVADKAIHPSGVLWGVGESAATDEASAIEQAVAAELGEFCRGLEQFEVETARRPLRLCPEEMRWEFPESEPATLRLSFALPAGAYATTLLRELVGSDFADG